MGAQGAMWIAGRTWSYKPFHAILASFPILVLDGVGEEGERQGGRRPGSLIWKTAEETVRGAGATGKRGTEKAWWSLSRGVCPVIIVCLTPATEPGCHGIHGTIWMNITAEWEGAQGGRKWDDMGGRSKAIKYLKEKHWKKKGFPPFLLCGSLLWYGQGGDSVNFEKGLSLESKEPWLWLKPLAGWVMNFNGADQSTSKNPLFFSDKI